MVNHHHGVEFAFYIEVEQALFLELAVIVEFEITGEPTGVRDHRRPNVDAGHHVAQLSEFHAVETGSAGGVEHAQGWRPQEAAQAAHMAGNRIGATAGTVVGLVKVFAQQATAKYRVGPVKFRSRIVRLWPIIEVCGANHSA